MLKLTFDLRVEHSEKLLENASGAMSIVFVAPVWKEAQFYTLMMNSKFVGNVLGSIQRPAET